MRNGRNPGGRPAAPAGAEAPVRKRYQQPTLRCHGKVTELTAGGSGMMQEMMGQPNPNRFP